jgi:hypothetical protein
VRQRHHHDNLSFGEWAAVFSDPKMITTPRSSHPPVPHPRTGNDSFGFKTNSAKAAKPGKGKTSKLDERLIPKPL